MSAPLADIRQPLSQADRARLVRQRIYAEKQRQYEQFLGIRHTVARPR